MENALVSIVMEKLGNPLVSMAMKKLGEEVNLIAGAKVELTKLSSTFKSIQAVLNHAETMQITNPRVRDWLEKLKDVAYDMEDVLDELILSAEETEPATDVGNHTRFGNQVWACLFSLFSCCGLEDLIRLAQESRTNGDQTDDGGIRGSAIDFVQTFVSKVESQRDLAHQIKKIKERLDQIADEKATYSFGENSSRGESDLDKAEFQTSSFVDESQMLGRDKDRDTIISKLKSGSSCEEGRIHVISIVGVGGLGKTTLAQLIFNDERVTSHFHKVLWVCVSDDFNVINLTKAIIEAAGGTSPTDSQLNSFQKRLRETLQDKLFLLVLDDVWNDDGKRWKKLWLSLQTGAPGSKILVTTRSEKVATICSDSAYMHKLEGLSDDDCWLLFRSRAFGGRKAEDCLALEKIGREIVKKCKGVPLSATVMGSAMRSKTTTQDWKDILESQTWEIPDIANGILPALLLSYYNLPLHLKPCFVYCSIFPKDHEMEKDRLVKLWLAQGFIKPQGRREMEAIGGEYFDDLLMRSLFQKVVTKYEEEEEEVRCTIHDLLHDLIQFITKNECCIFENGKMDSSSVLTVRHSSFTPTWETSYIPVPLCHAKKLRTLVQVGPSTICGSIPDNLFQCARSLRALDFRGEVSVLSPNIKELPSSIGLLKHLRYLDLSYSMIVELPESVTHLRNLQTLKLNYCWQFVRFPRGMGKLVSLRHLEFEGALKLKYLPEGLGRISSLRTLRRFIVGGDGGCKIGELKRLNSLQGKLEINHLERVGSVDEAKEAQLENKLHIRVLTLRMSRDDAHVLFPQSRDNALKMSESDEKLPDDDLEICESDEVLPDDEVSGDDEVERMDDVLEALWPPHTNVEKLVIERCIGSKFPTWMEDLPFSNLVDLRLINCYKCTQLPGLGRLPSLKYLQIEGGLVKRVGSEFYGNISGGAINRVAFPKLEELQFREMDELEEWELRLEDREIMPSLHSLTIYCCNKLKARLTHLPKSLTYLRINGCYEISADTPPENFTVWGIGEILWPLLNLPSLKTFDISRLKNTTCLPNGWKQLESLETLIISDCFKLRSLPDDLGQLKSLERLDISNCSKLRSLPDDLGHLKSLESLTIRNCSKLRSLPDDLGHLKSLESLTIDDCSKLRSLPDDLGQLKSLRSLVIYRCPELLSLPQGLQGLTSLIIFHSQKLVERCRGEDWSNISHIPYIEIDEKEIERGAQDENDDK